MSTAVTTDSKIEIKAGAIEKYRDVQEMIRKATDWIRESDTEDKSNTRTDLVVNMERSFANSILQLLFIAQDHDGPLTLWGDASPGSFFWKHEKSGYHGGLIFHRNHRIDDCVVGTWSIHT